MIKYVLLALVVLILLVLCCRTHLTVGYLSGQPVLQLRVLGIPIPLDRLLSRQKKKPTKTEEKKAQPESAKELSVGEKLKQYQKKLESWLELGKKLKDPALKAVRKLLQGLRVEEVYLSVTFGTGDPAATGMIYGAIAAVCSSLFEIWGDLLPIRKKYVDLFPDFNQETLQGVGKLTLSLRIITLLAIGLKFGYTYIKIKESKTPPKMAAVKK
jgi:hypothetical protein